MGVGKDKLLEMYRSMKRIPQFESRVGDLASVSICFFGNGASNAGIFRKSLKLVAV